MRSLLSRHDLDDDRVLIGFTAGVLWLVGALVGVVAQIMPGAPPVDPVVFAALALGVVAYGAVSISGWIDWSRVSVRQHAAATAVLLPLLGVVLWATGGHDSHLRPLLVLPLLHVAFFFPWRLAVPLVLELVAVAASPGLYQGVTDDAALSRLVTFTAVGALVTAVLRLLKTRLVEAEARQRRMATIDSLTGLANRRGFDQALGEAVAAVGDADSARRDADERPSFALLLLDLDRFKLVNDTLGHPAGDRLLREVAARCAARVRPADTLARIGGDEFALIAPGAGADGARRMADDLVGAVREAGAEVTVAWALHPFDGQDESSLLRVADRRLYEGKARIPG